MIVDDEAIRLQLTRVRSAIGGLEKSGDAEIARQWLLRIARWLERFLSGELDIENPRDAIAALHAGVQAAALGRLAVLFSEAEADQIGALVEAYMSLPRPYEDRFGGTVTVSPPEGPAVEENGNY
jgi:hypothetical protein